MKKFNKPELHILFWIIIPLLIYYFKWAAQDTTSLPGIPGADSESYFEIVKNNTDIIVISVLGSIPVYYWSLFSLTPKLLFNANYIKKLLYITSLIAYYFVVSLIIEIIFPMYYFFGTPYAIKVLAPVILLSALGGALIAYLEECQKVNLKT